MDFPLINKTKYFKVNLLLFLNKLNQNNKLLKKDRYLFVNYYRMDKNIRDINQMVLKMEMVYYILRIEDVIMEIGKMIKCME